MDYINHSIFPTLTDKRPQDERHHAVPIHIDGAPGIPAFCKKQNISSLSLLQLAWAITTRCYIGSDAIVFGYRADCDYAYQAESDFLCRVDLNSKDTIAALLERIHESIPSQKELDSHPLDNSLFNTFLLLLQDTHQAGRTVNINSPGSELTPTIYMDKMAVTSGVLKYKTHLVSHKQAVHIAGTFSQVIDAILYHTHQSVDQIDCFSTIDRAQIELWNGILPRRIESCVHHLISDRSSQQPQELAISSWDGEMTYGELHLRSSQLAKRLFSMGIGSEDIIPILFEKCKWTIVAIVGVMKARAAFVLLDPSYPSSRLATISQDVNSNLIIASSMQFDLASSLVPNVLCVSDTQTYWSDESASGWTNPASRPDDALYVVFTSGSTGKPKGVLIEHSAFATRAAAAGPALRLSEKPRVLQFSSYAFHVSYRDILTTLVWGGCLCVPSESARKNDLSGFMTRNSVSWACLTPSVVSLLNPVNLPNLKVLVVAGEQMAPATLDLWTDKVQLMNAYGPCECVGINALQQRLVAGMDCQNIGYGLGAIVWLVNIDDHEKLAPIGAVGEIVIEGPAMGRGYINHPQKTKEAFLSGAKWQTYFNRPKNQRLYKTGDLGRYNAIDGTITFIGRKDTQIKLNGQLVELREIEHHIQECLAVDGKAPDLAVELVTPKDSDVPKLIACIKQSGGKHHTSQYIGLPEAVDASWRQLEIRLETSLPKFMIPTVFIPMQKLPMTLSGKKDRKAIRHELASLSLKDIQAFLGEQSCGDPPCGELETTLQTLWATALNQPAQSIGRKSHIFRSGGDSVTAMRLVSLATQARYALTVDNVFQDPVLCHQAKHLQRLPSIQTHQERNVDPWSDYVPFSLLKGDELDKAFIATEQQCGLGTNEVEDIYPCTSMQEGLMALTLRAPRAYTAQHIYKLQENIVSGTYQESWSAVVQANPILRTRMIQCPAGTFQVVVKSPEMSWKIHSSLDSYLKEDKAIPMELGGQLVRFAMAHDESATLHCVVTIHHALYDAWSKSLIVRQVEQAYNGVKITSRPFAPFVNHALRSQDKSKSFWINALRDYQSEVFPPLPSSNYIPSPKASTEKINVACGKFEVAEFTISTRIQMAWALTISHYTASDDVVFGATVSGRAAALPAIDQTTGPTIATLPLRIRISPAEKVHDCLQGLQRSFIQSIPYEQLGLRQISKLSNEASDACKFQSLLVIQAKEDTTGSDMMVPVDFPGDVNLAEFGVYAMTMICQLQHDGNLSVRMLFDECVIRHSQIRRIVDHFVFVFGAINTNLAAPVFSIQSISPLEFSELSTYYAQLPKAADVCVQQIIERFCQIKPDAEAICAWDGSFTYSELENHANQVARQLTIHGLGSAVAVPIVMNKSKWVPAVVMGVIKAGRAFTLLDPAYPIDRILTVLKDIESDIVLSNVPGHPSRLGGYGIHVLQVSDFLSFSAIDSDWTTVTALKPSDYLYIAWTSGSTGKPKGAINTHASFASTMALLPESLGLSEDSRVLQLSSYAFDIAVLEILGTLMAGGCICIPSDEAKLGALSDTIREQNVSCIFTTATLARLLHPDAVPSIKTIMLGGEPTRESDIQTWGKDRKLVFGYGPAECSPVSSLHPSPQTGDWSSIGHAVTCACWIIKPGDPETLMPIGAVGELLIEGPNVGAGYLNDPVKTKSAFIESPKWLLGLRNGQKTPLYKTGDLVYCTTGSTSNSSGIPRIQLHFSGRKDQQVKLNGQRLEISEVEQHIRCALSGKMSQYGEWVEEVVGELIKPQANNERPTLVALLQMSPKFLSLKESDKLPTFLAPASSEFTNFAQKIQLVLRETLPNYMVPSFFFPLHDLPRTQTGKTDRRRLQDIFSSLSNDIWRSYTKSKPQARRPPCTGNEQTLYHCLIDALGSGEFGMEDNFFHIGGDSVVAMRLAGLARDKGYTLKVSDVFEHPVLDKLAQKLEISRKRARRLGAFELLGTTELRNEALDAAERAFNVTRDEIEDIYPCTALQEGMFALALQEKEGNQGKYISRNVFTLSDDINLDQFRVAWETTVKNNPTMRTRIISSSQGALQVVLAKPMISWQEEEGSLTEVLSHLPSLSVVRNLLSFSIIRDIRNSKRYFVITMHHSLYDGWSWRLLLDQVEAAYKNLPPPFHQPGFASFIQYIQDMKAADMTQFWKAQLANMEAPQFPILPSKAYKPNPTGFAKRTCVHASCSRTGVTLATILQLSWVLTLSQYTGSDESVFGLTTSGRDAAVDGIEYIMGPTFATIPVRTRLDRSKSTQELLLDMQAQVNRTIPYSHFGLSRIGQVSHDAAAACDFQNQLVIQPDATGKPEFFGKKIETPVRSTEAFDAYALTVVCTPKASGNSIDIEVFYDENVLSQNRVSWVLDQFSHTVEWAIRKPEGRIEDLPALSPAHFSQLCCWNKSCPDPVDSCIHELIFQYQKATPEAVAINAWDGDLTYGRLDGLSSLLAVRLSDAIECGSGVFVPISFEKSKWVVVAMLAVLKAGAAILLLDNSQPDDRQHMLCEEVSAQIVLTSIERAGPIASMGWRVMSVGDELAQDWLDGEIQLSKLDSKVSPNDPAYICFTSGSSGKPKGVVVEHGMFSTNMTVLSEHEKVDSQSRVLQFASFSFDMCYIEIFHSLANGGCICIPEESEVRGAVAEVMNRYQVTWAFFTPSVARAIDPSDVHTLRTLSLGGEPILASDIETWADSVYLLNSYGPTEACVDTHINGPICKNGDPSNIGSGIGVVSWVVDPDNVNRLLPLGAPGELLIEGPVVARGYLNQPEKTASAFIPPPSWLRSLRDESINRLYRTGDIVRFSGRGDASIQFVGRNDGQVKIRGQRIELGEVAYHLKKCFPRCKDAVAEVIKPIHTRHQPILTAFIHSKGGVDATYKDPSGLESLFALPPSEDFKIQAAEVESRLKRVLPPAMVPGMFIPIPRVPLTTSGKLDRRTLIQGVMDLSTKQWESYQLRNLRSAQPPKTPLEMSLHELVSHVLSIPIEKFGVNDDFIQLGGDSISAMKLVGLAHKRGFELAVRDILSSPSFVELAMTMHVAQATAMEAAPFELIPFGDTEEQLSQAAEECHVTKEQVEDIYPCTALQEGLLALSISNPGSYVAIMEFRLSDDIDLGTLQAAWKATFEANPILRTRVLQFGDKFVQVVLRDEFNWKTQAYTANHNTQGSVGLGTPLSELTVIPQPDGWYKFVFTISHALYDGWSLPLIFRQVEEAYRGGHLRKRAFTPFIEYLNKQNLQPCQDFWRSLLDGFDGAPFPRLPFNNYTPNPTSSLEHTLPTSPLPVTKSTAITLAWAVVLSQYTNSNDVVFGVTSSGRDAPVREIDTITGPTFTTHPFRVSLIEDQSLLQTIQQVHEISVNKTRAQHLGLHNIRPLSPGAASACEFQNLLVIQPQSVDSDGITRHMTPISSEGASNAFLSYGLTLVCDLSANAVRARMIFDDRLVSSKQAQGLLFQFEHVMDILHTESLHTSIAALYSLNSQDVSTLSQWVNKNPPRVDGLVHERFLEICRARGEETAVCAWDGEFTYGELDNLSSQLAWHLHSIGARPESFIPICLDKTCWVPVAIMAVIKSGAAFVLLDSTLPTERLKSICDDVKAEILIHSTLQSISSTSRNWVDHIVDITDPDCEWRQFPVPMKPPVSLVQPSSSVYCIFTSGSSGRPKGVVIEHRALCTAAFTHIDKGIINAQSRVLQFSSFAFDACILEIIFILLCGGCICIPSETERRDGLENAVRRMQVNHVILTPTFVRSMSPEDFPTLKTILLAGEPMSSKEVCQWENHAHLMNVYGPAECCVIIAIHNSISSKSDLSNVGYSMGGNLWVVNPSDHNKLVPIGAVGELVIGGATVGRGYLNNSAANEAAFITTRPPWLQKFENHSTDTRLYKTGDLVQYSSDGSLRILGRKDFQVKIRGQRVEIGEIESSIGKFFPGANGVAVELVQRNDGIATKILTAFIVIEHNYCDEAQSCQCRDGALFVTPCVDLQRDIGALKARLREYLPIYMVPAWFLIVRSFPTNPSGKTNRRELKDQAANLSLEEIASSPNRRLPVSMAEEIVLQICAKILKLSAERIGMEDSFFDLGGDSILAIALTSQARKQGVEFSAVDVFRSPKLSDLAAIGSDKINDQNVKKENSHALFPRSNSHHDVAREIASSSQLALSADDVDKILPVTGGQIMRFHEPCLYFAFHISGEIGPDRLILACQSLIQRYETLRSVFLEHKSTWIQVILKELNSCVTRYKTDGDLLSYVKSICRADTLPSPSVGLPMTKFSLVEGPDQKSILTIRLSHAQYDGYSFQVLCKDLTSLYNDAPLDNTVPYSEHIHHWAQAQKNMQGLSFWQTYLDGFQMSHIGSTAENALSKPNTPHMICVTSHILPLQPPTGITQATVVKAAWALTLGELSNTPRDITFGMTTSGRSNIATSDIFGLCINRIPVRVRLDQAQSLLDLIESIQQQHAESLEFELVEFKNMVPYHEGPMFGSVLTFQNTAAGKGSFELGSATCSWLPMDIGPLRTRGCVELEVTPSESSWEIVLGAPNTIWTSDRANEVMRVLCDCISRLRETCSGSGKPS